MAYAKAITLDNFSYNPSKFEVNLYNAIGKGFNSVKNGFQNAVQKAKNTFGYITETVFPENKYASVVVDNNLNVYDNLHEENLNTRGHLIHLIDRDHEAYSKQDVKDYIQYLKSKGKNIAKIQGYQAVNSDTGGMIAGIQTDRFIRNAIPVIGTDYFQKLAKAARHSETTAEILQLYTALHEISHSIRSPKNILYHSLYRKYPWHAEKYVEKQVYEYAMKKASQATNEKDKAKWLKIAEIAKYRESQVKEIYKRAKKHKNIEEKVKDEEVKKEDKDSKESKYSKEEKYEGKDNEKEYEGKEKEDIEENDGKEVNQDPDNLESKLNDTPEGDVSEADSVDGEASCEAGE